MERAVPKVASEEIELYLRTYYSLLKSSTEVKIKSLIEVHAGMNSLLHPEARSHIPDMSAFIYTVLRLPAEMPNIRLTVMGQSREVFKNSGIGDLKTWETVLAPARRRRTFFNGQDTLAVLIASRSDIDDLIPMLTAYQIEWNKMHLLLQKLPINFSFEQALENEVEKEKLAMEINVSLDDLDRLSTIWSGKFSDNMELIRNKKLDLGVQLLNGTLTEYRRAINSWWKRIEEAQPTIVKRPVYFVSSNSHSLINLSTGFALKYENNLVNFLDETKDKLLKKEWADIQANLVPSSRENFFYYVLKKYLNRADMIDFKQKFSEEEKALHIKRISSAQNFDIEAQIIPLSAFSSANIDPRLKAEDNQLLEKSNALILNIDYPLGLAAYQVLAEVADNVNQVLGTYIMGKSATLNGAVGDVIIPNVVYDGHSRNSYLFPNCFRAEDITPYLEYGTVLDNQKAVSLWGTFLQNHDYMDIFYREGYTDIEMEAGPYLSAIYEMLRPKRHPMDEIVNLYDLPFDFGLLHYASDKPISKGKNLGAASLSYFGMDPTYASSVAILKRIIEIEKERINK